MMPEKESYFKKLKGIFSRISGEEIETLANHFARAWKSEELIPQPQGYILIPLDRIELPEDPARKDLGDLESMKDSIELMDLLQPICVRPKDDEWRKFEPVMGLRRFQAFKELDKEKIPAYVEKFDEEEVAAIALIENEIRKDLTQPELLHKMISLREWGFTMERIAKMAGKSKSEISVYLRIPELPEPIGEAFFAGDISLDHVRTLSRLDEPDRMELFDKIMEEGLSSSDTRVIAKSMKGELELPSFFDEGEFLDLLGENLDFRRGKRSVNFTIRAESDDEMKEILGKILKMKMGE